MTLERVLRITGRILAAIFMIAAVILTLVLLAGSTLVRGIFSVPQATTAILTEEQFYQQVAPAILMAALDSVPTEVTVGDMVVPLAPLVTALRQGNLTELAPQIITREWVQQQITSAVLNALTGASESAEASLRDRVALIRLQLSGSRAGAVADFVLQAARQCTEIEINRLRLLQDAQRGNLSVNSVIDFVCAPPRDTTLRDVMRDVLVVRLAYIAQNLTADIAAAVASYEPRDLGVDTPLGRVSLVWPGVQLAAGSFTVAYSLPADVRVPVEEAVQQIRSELQAVNDRVTSEVEQSQQNLNSLRSQLSRTVTPAPTPVPTARAVTTTVPTTAPTAAPTVVPAIVPTAAPASSETSAPTLQNVRESLAVIMGQLAHQGDAIAGWIVLIAGVLLLTTVITVLHLLRTFRAMGLWTGAMLLLSGGGMLWLYGQITAPSAAAPSARALPDSIEALRTTFIQTAAQAARQQVTDPLQLQGIILVVTGVALLLAALYAFWRGRHAAPPPESPDTTITRSESAALVPVNDEQGEISMAQESTLVVFTLDSKERAKELLRRLDELDTADDNIQITEAAFATKLSRGRIKLEQFNDLGAGRGAFGGGTIGLIAGTVVAGPVGAAVGGVVGAAVSGLYTRLRDSGVDNKFMKEVSEKLEPGKTDLFIVYNGVLSETMLATLRDFDASVSYGALPAAATAALTEAYEASGEEIGSDMDVYTAEVTEADLVPTEIDLAPPVAVVVAETEAPADNLVAIDGIGPKISQALIAAGIRTFDDLHRTSEIHLRETLTDAKIVIPTSLPTWPRQAGLAAAGDWKGLYSYNAKRKLDSAKK